MAVISLDKGDLSVDTVHTPFGWTKTARRRSVPSAGEPDLEKSSQNFTESHVIGTCEDHEAVNGQTGTATTPRKEG
ncbi:hypothetical protein SAMN04487912_105284 [Arthrobacter sp. cf158]|nr:hypothetical protein SAMN04487912_105284 [Arthrobacter sp. cf158]